jgi:hypothetical protein
VSIASILVLKGSMQRRRQCLSLGERSTYHDPEIESGDDVVWKAFVWLEVWMMSRQTVMAWGESSLATTSASAFPNGNINSIISAKRRGVRASSWEPTILG